jgi:excisionase family DNA binding protein
MITERLLTIREVMARLNIKRDRAYDLVRSGALAHVRVGPRGIRVPETEVDRFIREHTHALPPARRRRAG